MDNLKRLFQSRKALIALTGIIAAVVNELTGRPVDQEIILSALGLIGLVIFGIAWEDAAEKRAGGNL